MKLAHPLKPRVPCVVNAEQVVLTGRKLDRKVYHHHTGHIGGIKARTAKFVLEGRFPQRIVEKAVERMLPRGPLGRRQLGNLRVYKGPEAFPDAVACFPHQAGNELIVVCGDGTLAVVTETSPGKFAVTQTVKTPKGARTMGLDPTTHRIYLPTSEAAAGGSEAAARGRGASAPHRARATGT